jgi:predicted phage tail protein
MTGEGEDRTPPEVRAEIEQTRSELGDTVEALVAKTDVKGQAKQAVADANENVAAKMADVKDTVAAKTSDVKESVAAKTAHVKDSVAAKTDEVTAAAQQTAPDTVGDASRRALTLAQDNRPALVAAATFALGLLIGSRRGR